MGEMSDTYRAQVNGWLAILGNDPAGAGPALDERDMAVITRDDGEQVMLRLQEELLGFYVMLFRIPEEKLSEYFKAALLFNLYPSMVGSGHLAYDEGAGTLTFCAQMPMELMSGDLFDRVVNNVFFLAENLRDQFFTLAGVPADTGAEAETEAGAALAN